MEREETFTEYFTRKKNKKAGHPHSVTNSWGVYDYYKYYRHNRPKEKRFVVTSEIYYKVIRMVNEAMADLLAKDHRLELPNHFGVVEFIAYPHKVSIENGRVRTSRPVDWIKTMQLWYEDPQAEKDKVIIRRECDEGMMVNYNKATAVYPNKYFYEFIPHRTVKRKYKEYKESEGFGTPYLVSNINIAELYDTTR